MLSGILGNVSEDRIKRSLFAAGKCYTVKVKSMQRSGTEAIRTDNVQRKNTVISNFNKAANKRTGTNPNANNENQFRIHGSKHQRIDHVQLAMNSTKIHFKLDRLNAVSTNPKLVQNG